MDEALDSGEGVFWGDITSRNSVSSGAFIPGKTGEFIELAGGKQALTLISCRVFPSLPWPENADS